MINQDKPPIGAAEANLTIGGAFTLLIGGIYQLIINPANVTAALTNVTKVSIGETWGTITSTWAAEPRTWLGVSQLIDNTSKPVTSIANVSKP